MWMYLFPSVVSSDEKTPVKMVLVSYEGGKASPDKKKTHATIPEMCFAIVKCMVGPAALYMPHGFADAGLGSSLVIVFIANALFAAGILRLLDCWKARAGRPESLDVATLATSMGGNFVGRLVQFCVCSLQLGVCVTYFIFAHETLTDVWKRVSSTQPPSMVLIVVLMILIEAPPSTIRDLQKLRSANAAGTILVATSLAVVAAYACVESSRGQSLDPKDQWRWVEDKPSAIF